MYPLRTWYVSGIYVWIPCIKETMMMMMMIMIIIIIITMLPYYGTNKCETTELYLTINRTS